MVPNRGTIQKINGRTSTTLTPSVTLTRKDPHFVKAWKPPWSASSHTKKASWSFTPWKTTVMGSGSEPPETTKQQVSAHLDSALKLLTTVLMLLGRIGQMAHRRMNQVPNDPIPEFGMNNALCKATTKATRYGGTMPNAPSDVELFASDHMLNARKVQITRTAPVG